MPPMAGQLPHGAVMAVQQMDTDPKMEQNRNEMKQHRNELVAKFEAIRQEIVSTSNTLDDFKQQQLPLARIKKIMKSDEDVRMISSEAPILFALACRLFITEVTHMAAFHARKQQRKTL